MTPLDPIVLTIDDTPARAAIDRVNARLDQYGSKAAAIADRIKQQMESQAASVDKVRGGIESMFKSIERVAASTAQSVGSVFRSVENAMGAVTLGLVSTHAALLTGKKLFLEFAAAGTASAAIVAQNASATTALEAAINRARVARVGYAAATGGVESVALVASEIAAVVAVEKLVQGTYEKAQLLQRQGIAAASSGRTYQAVANTDFVTSRLGVSSDFFNSASRAAGGIDELAKKLRDLGDVRDPITRVALAFQAFGSDAEKLLPFLDSRLQENISITKEWGLTLSQVDRENIGAFKSDIDALSHSFEGLGTTIKAFSGSVGNWLESGFAATYGGVKKILDAIYNYQPVDRNGKPLTRPGFFGGITGALFPDSLDAKELQRKATEASGLKDQAAFDLFRSSVSFTPAVGPPNVGVSAEAQKIFHDRNDDLSKAEVKDLISKYEKGLFVTDKLSPEYGNLTPAAHYPGGYAAEALAVQNFIKSSQRLDAILAQEEKDKKDKKSAEEAAAAAKALANTVKSQVRTITARAEDFYAGPTEKLFNERARELAELKERGASASQLAAVAKPYNPLLIETSRREAETLKRQDQEREQTLRGLERRTPDQSLALRAAFKDAEGFIQAEREIENLQLQAERGGIERQSSKAQRTAALTIDNPNQAIETGYQLQLSYAQKLYDADMRRAALEDDRNKRRRDEAFALADLYKTQEEARIDRAMKLLELEKQKGDTFKRTFADALDALQNGKFGEFTKQFFRGIQRRIEENVGGLLFDKAKDAGLTNGIKGIDPQSTIGKVLEGTPFAGRAQQIIPIADSPSGPAVRVIVANQQPGGFFPNFTRQAAGALGIGALLAASAGAAPTPSQTRELTPSVTSTFNPVSGGTTPAALRSLGIAPGLAGILGAIGGAALGGGSLGSAGAGSVSSTIDYGGGAISTGAPSLFGGVDSIVGGPGGTSGFAGPVGHASSGGGFLGGLGGIFGGGSGGAGGIGGIGGLLGGLKGIGGGLGKLIGYKGAGQWQTGAMSEGQGLSGALGGIGHSDLFAGAGLALAMNGLVGKNAGTWKGIAEGAAGGAMVGFKYGGPLGAAIGAAVGGGIGIGEKVFGVESKQNEAKRLVRDVYGGLSINSGMADQIVALAQQKYGGTVSIAVRDPQVRQMLELYSAGTGQFGKVGLSATTPRAGSLQEMTGQLYQQASYQYGNPYALASKLPTIGGGGGSVGTYPSPSNQPMSLTVNVGGQGVAQFVAGQVVTPEFVQAQWSISSRASNGRLANSAMTLQPGLVTN